jgi:hypothetical protein
LAEFYAIFHSRQRPALRFAMPAHCCGSAAIQIVLISIHWLINGYGQFIVAYCHLLSFMVTCFASFIVTGCHSLLLVVTGRHWLLLIKSHKKSPARSCEAFLFADHSGSGGAGGSGGSGGKGSISMFMSMSSPFTISSSDSNFR